jgi:uncharacterized protein (TIGR03435 family)
MISARLEAIQRGGPATAAPPDPNGCLLALSNPRFGPGLASFKGSPMAMIATILTQQVGRPVIDKTGLTSLYDFSLKWTPQPGSGALTPFGLPPGVPPDAVPPADPDAPNIFTALQEQLGLKLESARGPVEVVVIDRLEKPTLD